MRCLCCFSQSALINNCVSILVEKDYKEKHELETERDWPGNTEVVLKELLSSQVAFHLSGLMGKKIIERMYKTQ